MRVAAGLLGATLLQTALATIWIPDAAWVFAATHTMIAAWAARRVLLW